MKPLKNDFHVAVPTAFYKDESINFDLTLKHINYLYRQGVKSVLVCGSTGEQHSLSCDEKIALLQAIERSNSLADDLEIIFGVAAIRLKEAQRLALAVNHSSKVAAALVGFSPYILPSQQEAVDYIKTVARTLNQKQMILYNNPKRTGFDLANETLVEILKDRTVTNIFGLKEAGNPDKVKNLIELGYDHLAYYVGGEPDLKKKVALGFNSLSSILGNIYPTEVMNYFANIKHGIATVAEEEMINKHLQCLLNSPSILPTLKNEIAAKEKSEVGYCRSPLGLV